MEQVKLSIITINYNNREGLEKTIKSVVEQTDQNFEYIIIDGGSTDGSVEIIKEHETSIDYSVSEKDNGIYNAMNKGIRKATGEYCLFLNSGDYLAGKDVIKNVLPLLSGEDYITGSLRCLPNKKSRECIWNPPSISNASVFLFAHLEHQATFIKTSVLMNCQYDENYKIVSDWKQMFESLIVENYTYKPINILISNFDTTGLSSTSGQETKNERVKVLSEYMPYKVVQEIQKLSNHNFTFVIRKDKDRILFFIINTAYKFRKILKTVFHFFLDLRMFN
ncbi:MAG: glycosyltransferase family 2 protein [Bacteroidaceae bacterium]